jgi:hypothetical protein
MAVSSCAKAQAEHEPVGFRETDVSISVRGIENRLQLIAEATTYLQKADPMFHRRIPNPGPRGDFPGFSGI